MSCKDTNPCGDTGCTDIVYTDCVYTLKALPCLGLPAGSTLTEVLSGINSFVCNPNLTNTCKVKVSATDTCCDYLASKFYSDTLNLSIKKTGTCEKIQIESLNDCKVKVSDTDDCCEYLVDKINSNSLNITRVEDGSGCEQLMIEIPDCSGLVWTDIILGTGYVSPIELIDISGNVIGYSEIAQYAVDSCTKQVFLRGIFMLPANTSQPTPYAFTLDPAQSPQNYRVFFPRAFARTNNITLSTFQDALLRMYITPNGEVFMPLVNVGQNDVDTYFLLDGIVYETN